MKGFKPTAFYYQVIMFSVVLTSLAACSRKTENAVNVNTDSTTDKTAHDSSSGGDPFQLNQYLTTEPSDTATIQVIDTNCAIIIYPTDEQLNELKLENGEEDFYTIADDASYYQATAAELLDSMRIKSVDAGRHYLKLIGDEKTWIIDVRKKGLVQWGIILFNRKREPEVLSTPDLTVEIIQRFFGEKPQ